MKHLCKKAIQKIQNLSHLTNYLNDSDKNLIFKCNNKMLAQLRTVSMDNLFQTSKKHDNKQHETSLKIALNDDISGFETIHQKSNNISIHLRNIQTLMIELNQITNGITPPIKKGVKKGNVAISEICKKFSWRERELFLCLRNIKLLNYGSFCQKSLSEETK